MPTDYYAPLQCDEKKNTRIAEPILYDDFTGKLTREGVIELDFMAKILSNEDFEFYYQMLVPVAQKYLRRI